MAYPAGAWLCLIMVCAAEAAAAGVQFSALNALLCMRSSFVVTRADAQTERACANLCQFNDRCQGFCVANGTCQLFVFDRCSSYVRDCNCTTRAPVFVRKQPGLPPGALCPTDFAGDFCGTKYKVYSGITDWNAGRSVVSAAYGLVTMADVVDVAEVSYQLSLMRNNSWSLVFTGGYQLPGSAEPAGGWVWTSCNTAISSGVWGSGEPNNDGNENAAVLD